jgi:fido (protein-threonine AMPylation protein)
MLNTIKPLNKADKPSLEDFRLIILQKIHRTLFSQIVKLFL